MEQNLGRQSLLVTLALALAAAIAAAGLSWLAPELPGAASSSTVESRATDPEVLALLGNEIVRSRRLEAVSIADIRGVEGGAIRVELRSDAGEPFSVEILKRDPAGPSGIAETEGLSFYVVSAPGAPTPEYQARAVQALARIVAAQEARGAAVPGLRSMRERDAGAP